MLGESLDHRKYPLPSGRRLLLPRRPLRSREETIRRHLALAVDYYGEKVGTRDFRKHLLWYTKGLRGGAQFRQVAGRITDRAAAWEALRDYFHCLAETVGAL